MPLLPSENQICFEFKFNILVKDFILSANMDEYASKMKSSVLFLGFFNKNSPKSRKNDEFLSFFDFIKKGFDPEVLEHQNYYRICVWGHFNIINVFSFYSFSSEITCFDWNMQMVNKINKKNQNREKKNLIFFL